MWGVKSKIYCLFTVFLVAANGQMKFAFPLSKDSFRQIQRALISVPKGRKTELSDIRINFYSTNEIDSKLYKIGKISSLLSDPVFDLQKRTMVYIHGYVEKASDSSVARVVKAYLAHGGFNILVLDWANLAFGDYISALLNVKPVGNEAGKGLLKLLKQGLNIEGLHIVGHSMGAHVGAVIARYLKIRGYTIPRLTGLDAAHPGFYPPILTAPINPKDADFVDIIHTDGGWFGAPDRTGHVDFWPNDGTAKQPGCLPFTLPLTVENFCSHWRSWLYWAESVEGGEFVARKCDNYDDFLRGKCSGNGYMGLAATPNMRGNYYLRTATREPFALGEKGAL
ncbi:pancreatic lipase-related protein 2-like isoform X2 [Bicyclus anynana]|uniref:Pancreatic lipase-related protein 2-like isoform X2 n=1 Tax=Bicyclus anynana TaxID=110368 RepID=A0A6J1P860_BICAN|nr:pancreatic lipase-related protein 2-like isoform X2 [Bicyclus anynana]